MCIDKILIIVILYYNRQNTFTRKIKTMNKTQFTTKYIIEYIHNKQLVKGNSLPTLREIASACDVSLFIAKKAIEVLARHGVVNSQWGSGNFIKDVNADNIKDILITVEQPKTQTMHKLEHNKYLAFIAASKISAFSGGYLSGINDIIKRENFLLTLEMSNHSVGTEIENIHKMLANKDISGIIIDSLYKNEPPPYLNELKQRGIPCAFVGDSDFGSYCQTKHLGCDNNAGFLAVMNYLYDMGHRHIAFVGTPRFGLPANQERYNVYKNFLAEKKLPELYIAGTGGEPEENFISEIRNTQCFQDKITAFACCGDAIAKELITACRLLGLKVPADISVTGFDAREWTAYYTPALTSVFYPTEEIGRAAAEELLAKIKDPLWNIPDSIKIKPRLIIRNSVEKINTI